jgi:DNA-binding NarL/FixJ family response regulator
MIAGSAAGALQKTRGAAMKDSATPAANPPAENHPSPHKSRYGRLTARELQVLELLAEGLSNKMISRRLEIAPATVKCHVGRILAATGAGNRLEAVVVAARRGLLSHALGTASCPADDASEDRGPP